MKKEQIEIKIPFQGFYETIHMEKIEEIIEEEGIEIGGKEDNVNYKKMMTEYARSYVDELSKILNLNIEFTDLDSPKQYNYRTDEIYIIINKEDLKEIYKEMLIEEKELLKELIKETFTQRPGFVPLYPNDIEDWLKEDFEKWDEVQLSILLEGYINSKLSENYENYISQDIYIPIEIEKPKKKKKQKIRGM
jgi:hypothetical protein